MPVLPHHPPCSLGRTPRTSAGSGGAAMDGALHLGGRHRWDAARRPVMLRYWPPAIGPGATADLLRLIAAAQRQRQGDGPSISRC